MNYTKTIHEIDDEIAQEEEERNVQEYKEVMEELGIDI